jgi:hypothetical protein
MDKTRQTEREAGSHPAESLKDELLVSDANIRFLE